MYCESPMSSFAHPTLTVQLLYRPHSVYREAASNGAGSSSSASRQLFAPLAPLGKEVFEESFKKRDTVIYFHGNG
jgi:hypothetical protein